jgi:hypothetical protein
MARNTEIDGLDGLVTANAHGNYDMQIRFVNSHGRLPNSQDFADIPRGKYLAFIAPKGTAWGDVYGENTNGHWIYITKVRDSPSAKPVGITTGGTTKHPTYSVSHDIGLVMECAYGNYRAGIQFVNSRDRVVAAYGIAQGQCEFFDVPKGTVRDVISGKYNTHNYWFFITDFHATPSFGPIWVRAGGTTVKPTSTVKFY